MIFSNAFMAPLFGLLEQCRGVEQMDVHHPEGDVFAHSLQVLRCAFRESNDTDLILAAMLHDVGKAEESKGHEKLAVEWLRGHVSVKTLWLIEHHMRIWYLILGEMKRRKKVRDLIEHPWLPELILLARWDKMGRSPGAQVGYDRAEIVDRLNRCVERHFYGKTD